MSKTPEEMAEEYFERRANTDNFDVKSAFLAGYKAGCENTQTQLAVGEKIVKELLGKTQWISIKDRLPEEGTLVLLTDSDDSYNRISVGHRMFSEFDGWSWYVPGKVLVPEHFYTHWQSLPEAPKEKK